MKTILNRDVKLRPRKKVLRHQYVKKPIPLSLPLELADRKEYRNWKKGDSIEVNVRSTGRSYDYSRIVIVNLTRGGTLLTDATRAHTYSDDFISWGEEDLMQAVFDGACPSLTGQDIEPDGVDEYGFPSIVTVSMLCDL